MDLRQLSRNAAAAQQLRHISRCRERAGKGKIWREAEIALLHQLYPDYQAGLFEEPRGFGDFVVICCVWREGLDDGWDAGFL